MFPLKHNSSSLTPSFKIDLPFPVCSRKMNGVIIGGKDAWKVKRKFVGNTSPPPLPFDKKKLLRRVDDILFRTMKKERRRGGGRKNGENTPFEFIRDEVKKGNYSSCLVLE